VPWHIEKRDDKFCVIKDDDDENEGCHDTEAAAKRQMAALYANENRSERSDEIEMRASCRDYFSRALNSDNPASALDSICALDRGASISALSERFGLPHHASPGSPPDRACVAAAWSALAGGRTGRPMSGVGVDAARSHLASHRRSLGMGDEERQEEPNLRAPIETRSATLSGVDVPRRELEVVAVPYGGEAVVEYRGEVWLESFERGSFDGIEGRPNRIKAIRDHDKTKIVGRAISFSPEREEGLVSVIKLAQTPNGDETLALAKEDMIDVSAGFAVRGRDQVFDRAKQTRLIRKAFLDHIAFVADGAYEGARVLDVRKSRERAASMEPLVTPRLDEVVAWLESRRTSSSSTTDS
jgi:HK97 family phage prohead protease